MLGRDERFEAIAVADPEQVERLADLILASHEVTVLRPPTGGAVMMRAIETASGSVFNVGEVAVTEAEVALGSERGYAMVMGFAPKHALAGAVIDAAAEAGVLRADELAAFVGDALKEQSLRTRREWAAVAPTRVSFDEIPQ